MGGTDQTSQPKLSALLFAQFNQDYIDVSITKQSTAHGAQILNFLFIGRVSLGLPALLLVILHILHWFLAPTTGFLMFYTFPSGCELDASVAQDFQSFNFVSGINQ